jgi:uncharacterized metal-binding protein YceD (DUF177 family)
MSQRKSERKSKPVASPVPDRASNRPSDRPWGVPVALSDVPETGRHFALVADEHRRDAIAKLAGLAALPRLDASFDVAHHGRSGLRVVGHVSATISQTCVVTLEPIENEIDEPVDLVFAPAAALPADDAGAEVEMPPDDELEPLVDGTVDLGAIATEFLVLAIDPYPRKPDAVFEAPAAGDDAAHPFAALAALKKGSKPG